MKKNLLFKKFKICKNKSSVIFNIANFKKNKILICLVSNASEESVNAVLKKYKLNKFFNSIITSTDMSNCKSDGVAFKKILKKFRSNKNNTIVIDDNNLGIKASIKNNLQVLIVKNFN